MNYMSNLNVHNLPESPYYGFDEQYAPYPITEVSQWLAFHDRKQDRILVGYEYWHTTKGKLVEVSTRFLGTLGCLWESMVFVDHSPVHELTKRRDDWSRASMAHGYNSEMARHFYPPREQEEGDTPQMDSVFPTFTDTLIDNIVDMEYVTQSDDSWKEAPTTAVLLAVEVLKSDSFLPQPQQGLVAAMAKETIFNYGNWRNHLLDIAPSIRQEMYQRNYEGEPWQVYYHEDGF